MTALKRIGTALLDSLRMPHRFSISPAMGAILEKNPLVIADVGAAMGVDRRWSPVQRFLHFLTFEPDARSALTEQSGITNYTIGLGSEAGDKTLHLASLPAASSLYRIDQENMRDFALREWLEIVGETTIPIDTLDHCLGDSPPFRPAFIKIDTEGSDLDILRGAALTLQKSLLGVEVEVSFASRHLEAPCHAEIDAFLRENGFLLQKIVRQSWMRTNLTFGANVYPQLIYGDAIYFLRYDEFASRLGGLDSSARLAEIVKFVLLLQGYGFHDYAIEILEKLEAATMLPEETARDLREAVQRSVVGHTRFFLSGLSRLGMGALLYLVLLPIPGAGARIAPRLRILLGHLAEELSRVARRCGPRRGCISEDS